MTAPNKRLLKSQSRWHILTQQFIDDLGMTNNDGSPKVSDDEARRKLDEQLEILNSPADGMSSEKTVAAKLAKNIVFELVSRGALELDKAHEVSLLILRLQPGTAPV